jgi:Flp pilus assembly protein TadD
MHSHYPVEIKPKAGNRARSTVLRFPLIFLAVTAAAGCATTTTTPFGEPVANRDAFYSGEPEALHATEYPVTSAAEGRTRAQAALAQNDLDLALYLYVQAVNLEPQDAESLFMIAAIHESLGNSELAARAFAAVVEIEPENALAQQGLGIALFDSRRFEEAVGPLTRATELDPSFWRAHNTLGIIADREERYDLAVSNYTSAIELQPMLASVRNNRGYSKYLSGDLEGAKRDFLVALEIDPEYERALRNLGLVYAREEDYDLAISTMRRAIAEHVALNDVGYVAMLDGNYGVAQLMFEDAIFKSPRHYQIAQDNLAELRRRTAPELLAIDQ